MLIIRSGASVFNNGTKAAIMFLTLLSTSACLVRRQAIRPALRHPGPLLTANKDQLIARIHDLSDPIESFLMNASLSASVLNPSKGVITEYPTIDGYILFRRPAEIRIVGKAPMWPGTILDMVCHENRFQLHLPSKNLLLVGDADAPGKSSNALENLRPDAFLKSLTIAPPDPGLTILENDTNQTGAVYILLILDRAGDELRLVRSVYFDRNSLRIIEQRIFDSSGSLAGDTKYSNWKSYQGISYPSAIDIQRVQENYEVNLLVLNMKMNPPNVTPDKFLLTQPPSATVRQLN
jgi:hypothetical protein